MSVKINKSLDDGLVLYVPMDEGSGSTVYDKSKYGHNGIVPSGIWEVQPEKGKVPHFNNLLSKNLDIPASTDFDLQEQTVAFWFKADAINSLQIYIFSREKYSSNWMFYRNAHWSNGRLGTYRCYTKTDTTFADIIKQYTFEVDTWYHVCFVFHSDGSSEDYIDGVLRGDNAIPADFDYWTTSTSNHYTSMQGYLKDIRIYNRALSSDEVSALYRLGVTKNLSDGLVLYLPMNEGSGTTVYDKSKYSNNGTVNGATWINDEEKGTVLSFDGVDDYTLVPYTSLYNFRKGNFSLCAWVKFTTQSSGEHIIIRRDTNSTPRSLFGFFVPSSRLSSLAFQLFDIAIPLQKSTLGVDCGDGEWHFAVGVREGDNIILYVDGIAGSPTTGCTNLDINNPDGNLAFASYHTGTGAFFDGEIKDVRIYNRALSTTEIGQLYRLTQKGVE